MRMLAPPLNFLYVAIQQSGCSKPLSRLKRSLRGLLTKVKDPLPIEKQANVVYEVPCTCGQVYIGETRRRLGTRLKEHRDACRKGLTDKSAVVEHAWTNGHPIRWDATEVLQRASRTMELVMKESLSIRTKPESERFNCDNGFELPKCWIATYKKLRGGASRRTTHAHLNARASTISIFAIKLSTREQSASFHDHKSN